MLDSFAPGLRAVVIGASGGIGRALTEALAAEPRVGHVLACSRSLHGFADPKVAGQRIDLLDEPSILAAAEAAGEVDLVIVAVGVLGPQPEKTWRQLEPDALAAAFRVNAIGPALAAKHFLPRLGRGRKTAFAALSARVGSIADNRSGGWHAYRASKAALNMLIRTLSIELARQRPEALCVGLHPGTVDTGLSKPFQAGVPEGKLFTSAFAASRLLGVLDGLTPEASGRVFAWDGQEIPP